MRLETAEPRARRGTTDRGLRVGIFVAMVMSTIVVVAVFAVSVSDTLLDDPAGGVVRLFITIGIPVLVVVGFWIMVRRQVRRATSRLRHELALERKLTERVSHDFRDRVTVIYGFSETLLDGDLDDPAEVREIVTVINGEAVDLGRIAEDLVSASQLRSDGLPLVSAGFDPAIEVERVVLPFARRGRDVSVDCWSGTGFSDPIRFRQIVRTLVSNAVEHGGNDIAIVGELDGSMFRCSVTDDGEGIDAALLDRFFPTGALPSGVEGPGTTGLAVAMAVAEHLGGHLTYSREEDCTVVSVSLPAADWPDVADSTTADAGAADGGADDGGSTSEHADPAVDDPGGSGDLAHAVDAVSEAP